MTAVQLTTEDDLKILHCSNLGVMLDGFELNGHTSVFVYN